jgi:PhnB protein
MKNQFKTAFAPVLYIPTGTINIDFYKNAFGAIELRRFSNDDGSIHVVEFTIDVAMFHLHEENYIKKAFSPLSCNGTTINIGLMVDDVDSVMAQALAAGAKEISPAQDFDYGFRQGDIIDPFGHHWTIQKVIEQY